MVGRFQYVIFCRFGRKSIGLNCLELTGDTDPDSAELEAADIICTTPEKFDSITRKLNEHGGAKFFGDVSDVVSKTYGILYVCMWSGQVLILMLATTLHKSREQRLPASDGEQLLNQKVRL